MVETHTDPTDDLAEIARQLREARRTAIAAAEESGVAVVAVATAPLGSRESRRSASNPRYERIVQEFGDTGRGAGTLGMHVHVDVADDEEGVRVIDGLRPWLPLLTALTSNSPYASGRDTGYASWRQQVWTRWPTVGYGGALRLGRGVPPRERHPDPARRRLRRRDALLRRSAVGGVPDASRSGSPTPAPTSTTPCSPPRWPGRWSRPSPSATQPTEAPRSDLLRAAWWRAARYGLTGASSIR